MPLSFNGPLMSQCVCSQCAVTSAWLCALRGKRECSLARKVQAAIYACSGVRTVPA